MRKIVFAGFILAVFLVNLISADFDEWQIKIGVKTEKYRDSYNFIGVSKSSSFFYDEKDILEPPASPTGLWLYIPHFDWSFNPGRYATDYRPPFMNEESYDFIIETGNNTRITLFWSGTENVPKMYRFKLINKDRGISIDMRESTEYSLDCSPGGKIKFVILVRSPREYGIKSIT